MTTCLISGVTSGIGYALGCSLMRDGHKVVGIGRNVERLEELKDRYGELFVPVELDLGRVEEIKTSLGEALYGVDSFVHCAGVSDASKLRKITYSRFLSMMNVNFFSFVELVRLLVGGKEDERSMRIIGISSAAARGGFGNNVMYGSCKAAMDGFVRQVNYDLIGRHVEINTLQPCFVDTRMLNNLKTAYGENFETYVDSYQPMGLIPVEDLVEEIRFLLFKKGMKVSGTARYINGGRS